MKTTRKQLVNFAIGLVKEVASQNKNISVEYRTNSIVLWFLYDDRFSEHIGLYLFSSLKENKVKFRKAILKIRGIILWKEKF